MCYRRMYCMLNNEKLKIYSSFVLGICILQPQVISRPIFAVKKIQQKQIKGNFKNVMKH